jgi:hypothetical protein
MEAARTSETSVNFYQTTRRHNPEDSHLRTHRCENLKSHLENVRLEGCENWRWIEQAKDHVQWRARVLAVFNLRALPVPESFSVLYHQDVCTDHGRNSSPFSDFDTRWKCVTLLGKRTIGVVEMVWHGKL